jgi:hypothetical protein
MAKKVEKKEAVVRDGGPTFVYKKVKYKFLTEMLGTCTEVGIYKEHVLKKAQKEIAKANKLHGKIIKSLEKYRGTVITPEKELQELKAILRAYQERVGKMDPLPDSIDELLDYSKEVAKEYEEMIARGESQKATVFMRDTEGRAIISTHMIIGNLKENLRNIVNNSEAKSKSVGTQVAVGEVMATDIKVVEDFIRPSHDIVRKENGEPDILERPIRFKVMGETKSAIAMSEYLPKGTEIEFTFRIRRGSPVLDELPELLELGQNCGLGQWRGSGKKGAFMHKIEDCEAPVHEYSKDGWK